MRLWRCCVPATHPTQPIAAAFLAVAALAASAAASTCPYSCDYEVETTGEDTDSTGTACKGFQTCFVGKGRISDSDYCGPRLGNCDDDPGSFVTFFRNQETEYYEALCEYAVSGYTDVACCDEYERIK